MTDLTSTPPDSAEGPRTARMNPVPVAKYSPLWRPFAAGAAGCFLLLMAFDCIFLDDLQYREFLFRVGVIGGGIAACAGVGWILTKRSARVFYAIGSISLTLVCVTFLVFRIPSGPAPHWPSFRQKSTKTTRSPEWLREHSTGPRKQ